MEKKYVTNRPYLVFASGPLSHVGSAFIFSLPLHTHTHTHTHPHNFVFSSSFIFSSLNYCLNFWTDFVISMKYLIYLKNDSIDPIRSHNNTSTLFSLIHSLSSQSTSFSNKLKKNILLYEKSVSLMIYIKNMQREWINEWMTHSI
jgi:hypothetical protein